MERKSFKKSRGLAMLMALLMVLSILPTEMLGKNAKVLAAEGTVAEGEINLKGATVLPDNAGVTTSGFAATSNLHGLHSNQENATITLKLSGKATLTVTTCCYGNGASVDMNSSSGEVTYETIAEEEKNARVYTVAGATGDTTLTFGSDTYVHSIKVEYVIETYIDKGTSVIYGTLGGTPNFSFCGVYSQWNGLNVADSIAADGAIKWIGAKYHSGNYGIAVQNGDSLKVAVKGSAKVSFVTSQYNESGARISVSSSDPTGVIDTSGITECKVGADGNKLSVTYTAGSESEAVLTFNFSGTVYVPAIIVEPEGVYLDKGTTTKVIFTGTIGATNAGDYTDDVNDLTVAKSSWDNIDAADLKHANDAVVLSAAKYHGTDYGLNIPTGSTLDIKVAGSATITMMGSVYSDEGNITAVTTDSAGSFEEASVSTKLESDKGNITIKYTGNKKAKLTFTFGANTYVGNIIVAVENLPESSEIIDEANNFKVWLDDLATNGTVTAGTREYGGSNVTLVGQGETQFTVLDKAANVVRDGEKHNGYKAGNRHANANDIPSIPQAGDGCCVEFESKVTGMFKVYFWSSSFLRVWDFDTSTGEKLGYKDSETAADFYAFETKPGHTYVMSTTGATNNMAYVGYEFIQNNQLEVPVEFSNVDADADKVESMEITITDAALGTKAASVTKGTTAVSLLKNHTYVIESNDGGIRPEVSGKDSFVATGDKVTFELYNVPDVTLTGAITGTPEGTVTSLKFVNMVNSSTYTATINGSSYSCSMKPGEYNTIVETTNGGKTYDRVSVKAEGTNVNEVYVEVPDPGKARKYGPAGIAELEITGNAVYRPSNGDFLGQAGATIKVPVSGKANVVIETYYQASYKVNGKEYTNTTGATSTNQADSMVVDGDFVIEFIGTTYFKGISVTPIVEFKDTISVPGDYKTLNEAFTTISSMEGRPEGEAGRVTVELNCDIFEQTVVNAPYVTLKGNGHTVSWYYGVGTLYYSVDPSTGLYNERLARDKYSYKEGNANLWGGVFIVRGNNFIAEDTTFKNTYNYELTDAEKSDIAGSTLSVSRLADGANVAAYAYKERSNAFYIEADNIECYNCKILSSQDTLGRNGSTNNGYHAYFNKCVIGGNVDYICGEFAAVFDNCELQWKTFAGDTGSNNGKIGFIVAPKTSPNVFRNCTVTLDDENAPGVAGLYGRTWGANSNAVFINTETNGYIKADGWGEMGSGEKASAVFKEYNNTSNGKAFVSTGTSSDNQTLDAVKDYIETEDVSIVNTVLNNWIPVHYAYEITKPDVPGEKPDVPGEKPDVPGEKPGEEPGEEPGKDDDKVIVKPEKPENVDPAKDVVMSGVTASSDVEFKDNAGNVVLSGTVEIKAEPITNTVDKTDLVSKVNSIMSQVSNVAVRGQWYVDINAKSGGNVVKVSQGTLTISLSIPTDITYNPLVDVVTVLHKKADGTIQSETVTKGGGRTISFTVNSLSPFAIVVSTPVYGFGDGNTDNDSNDNSLVADASNGSTANSGTSSSTAKPETGTSVKTGDSAPVVPLVLIAAACLGVLVICSKKRAR